jgi:hypothetical protein
MVMDARSEAVEGLKADEATFDFDATFRWVRVFACRR